MGKACVFRTRMKLKILNGDRIVFYLKVEYLSDWLDQMQKLHNYEVTITAILLSTVLCLLIYGSLHCGPCQTAPKTFNFSHSSVVGMQFADKVSIFRQFDMRRIQNMVYLDYATKSLFTDSQISSFAEDLKQNLYGNPHSESPSSERSTDVSEDIRRDLLRKFGTTLSEYTLVFAYSGAQALKVIAEAFPFTNSSAFLYPRSSNNNILGLRGFAARAGAKVTQLQSLSIDPSSLPSSLSLITLPLTDEFDGSSVPEDQISHILSLNSSEHPVATLVDASLYIQTHQINLASTPFDAVAFSFERIFGYPTLGAVIFKNTLFPKLVKPYFGGGTLVYALTESNFEKLRLKPAERFEDGSIPFLTIASIRQGLNLAEDLGSPIEYINRMAETLTNKLKELRHQNGSPLCRFYQKEGAPFVTFNVQSSKGDLIDFREVVKSASDASIYVIGGCFSTPGTCFDKLNVDEKRLEKYIEGADDEDVSAIGAIRASIGWATTDKDVERFTDWLSKTYGE